MYYLKWLTTHIAEIVKELREQGFKVTTEFEVKTPGGFKDRRWADIFVEGPGEQFVIQVGRNTKSGRPISREMKAIYDIATKHKVKFYPYN